MIKKRIERIGEIILVCCLVGFTYSCTPEDGINGVDGIDGIDGTDGADGIDGIDGIDGADGADGVGFDELTKYGSISTTLTGTRVDGEAFTQSDLYKFTPVAGLSYFNSVEKSGADLEFKVGRFISAPDDVFQYSSVIINLKVTDAGLETQSFDLNNTINELTVVSDDLKFFTFSGSGWNDTSTGVTNMNVTDYS